VLAFRLRLQISTGCVDSRLPEHGWSKSQPVPEMPVMRSSEAGVIMAAPAVSNLTPLRQAFFNGLLVRIALEWEH